MKTARIIMAVAFMFSGFLATDSLAAKEDKGTTGAVQTPSGEAKVVPNVTRASKLTGATVKNTKGEDIGEIEDLVISKDGRIQYVVLAHGGILGAGEKLFAVPWKAVKAGDQEDSYIVNIDKERLAQAPSFQRNNWPNFADRDVYMMYYGYYGVEPDRDTQTNQGMSDRGKSTTDMNK
jgi:sporulation protein YlmC with PRC-barrel domain